MTMRTFLDRFYDYVKSPETTSEIFYLEFDLNKIFSMS